MTWGHKVLIGEEVLSGQIKTLETPECHSD
jgi:hypothetical protein